ncbi:MAG: hypothetical protein EAY75_00110, partial [Bacteroidetes bacterium]
MKKYASRILYFYRRMVKVWLGLGFVFLCIWGVNAQSGNEVMQAVKVQKAPALDGLLTDSAWAMATPVTKFVISQPEFGLPSKVKSEVRMVYTNEALYVAAMLYDDPKQIRRQLTSRDQDQMQDADKFGVLLDTYNDKQNAFYFLVTSANVQTDARISAQGSSNGGYDTNWDAVWDSRVAITDSGWVVEMEIPYMSLRFAPTSLQDWGLNFYSFTRRYNETAYWNTVDPKAAGLVNQSGLLVGLQDLKPPLRLSFLPYVSTGVSSIPTSKGKYNTWLRNGGMDVKYGVNESFTLDVTLIPDFGQVQSDNVILNLSPFEVQFQENRPFFTEGTELFNKAGIFYSRRVGGTPEGYYDARAWASRNKYTLQKNPASTQLYNAIKFSGRTKKNLGIGVFNAITAPMYAKATNERGEEVRYQTEALANYSVVVLDQALKNRSYITFTNTNVYRADRSRDANVSALDLSFLDKKNLYNFTLQPRLSLVTGANASKGWKNVIGFAKVSGAWQWSVSNNIESPNYNHNDLGILRAPNQVTTLGAASWQQFTPNKYFNYRLYSLRVEHSKLYSPFVFTALEYSARFLHVFKNFWDLSLNMGGRPTWTNDYFDLRTPGRMVKKTPYTFFSLRGSTDSRKALFVRGNITYADLTPIENDAFTSYGLGLRYRFNPKLSLDVGTDHSLDRGNIGFSHFKLAEPIIGRRNIATATTVVNGIYNFKARMNLTMRLRHYWSNVQYTAFYTVKPDGWWTDRAFEDGRNRNFNAFNIDAFYTWDFMPGSRLMVA